MHFILPSGKLTVRYGKWPIEIADLPLKLVIFHSVLHVYQRVKMARLVSLATSWPTYLLDPELSTRHTWARIMFVGHVKKSLIRAASKTRVCEMQWKNVLELKSSVLSKSVLHRILPLTSTDSTSASSHLNIGVPATGVYLSPKITSWVGKVIMDQWMVFRFCSSLSGTKPISQQTQVLVLYTMRSLCSFRRISRRENRRPSRHGKTMRIWPWLREGNRSVFSAPSALSLNCDVR